MMQEFGVLTARERCGALHPPAAEASISPAALDMTNPLSPDATENPMTNAEAYQGSIKSLLSRNLGSFVVATFLVGAQESVVWQGILHTVGNDYIVLYQPDRDRYVSGDIYSLKFVEFHPAPVWGQR